MKHILLFFLFIFFGGTLFFIPAIFVNRFTTTPALWMQAGICIGVAGYVLLAKGRMLLPPKGFLFLMIIWAIYHICQNGCNAENGIMVITLVGTFFLFYALWKHLQDKSLLFTLLAFLAIILSLWGLGQFTGLLSSYNGSFSVTGPFDNPAGISAALVVLLPFSMYCTCYLEKKYRPVAIIATCLILTVIVLSKARTAVLAAAIIFVFLLVRLLKERGIRLLPIHYTVIAIGCLLLFVGLFFMKKDSANGRLLIWQCSAKLISRNPVSGYGGNGFTANYMNEQASYFTKHPDSKYVMLADNVRHPFNEFLKWTINYGIIGLSLTLLLVFIPLWVSRKNDSRELFFIRLGLLSIGICAFFSYPFNYPFVRLMLVMLTAFTLAANPQKSIEIRNNYLVKGLSLLFSCGLLCATAYHAYCELEWHRISHKSLRGGTVQMIPQYKSLYTRLRHSDLFLYNYAAELNIVGQYNKSLKIARECDNLWADYDLQMLMADNCRQLKNYDETE